MFVLDTIARKAKTDALAALYNGRAMTYYDLDRRSGAIAAFLLEACPTGKTPVVIYGHKEMDFLSCMFGSLKAGHAYVPIDISFPQDRVEAILSDVSPEIVVDFTGSLSGKTSARLIGPEDLSLLIQRYEKNPAGPESWVRGDDICYIMFTSGSTGAPKGVPISCANLETMWKNAKTICDTKEPQGIALNAVSYSFDLSVMPVYVAVGLGMTLFTVDKYTQENFRDLFSSLSGSGISFWVSTPSFAEMCAISEDFSIKLLPQMKTFFFCGEILTNKLAGQLLERFPKATVYNTYGPTEATVFVTATAIGPIDAESPEPLPVGRFFPEITPRIVDEAGREVQSGEKGELLIIGECVSSGYFKRPDLTEKSFFMADESGRPCRGYRTGDICILKGDMLHYCGRNDLQIKLNGYRIEIEDIEKNLMKLKSVKRAAVCPVYEDGKVSYLAAFILPEGQSDLPKLKQIAALKSELKQLLPAYMVPRKIIIKDRFPVNQNGKVDKKALLSQLS